MKMSRFEEKFYTWVTWKLPKKLVYWCAVRLMAWATQGQWGNQSPNDVNIMDALKRWA